MIRDTKMNGIVASSGDRSMFYSILGIVFQWATLKCFDWKIDSIEKKNNMKNPIEHKKISQKPQWIE